MLWFIIVAVVIVIIFVKTTDWHYCDLIEKIFFVFSNLLIWLSISVFMMILCGLLVPNSQKEFYIHSEEEIYSITDNIGVEGQFVLGFGSIESNLKYYYMVTEKFGYKVKSLEMKDTNIIEVDTTPKYKTYYRKYKNVLLILIAIDIETKNVLEVPKNTVKINYEIDMK